MTKQEIFNKVYIGLRNQGWERSVNAAGRCVYRNSSGLKCAIGQLIPDDKYDLSMDNGMCLDLIISLSMPELSEHYYFLRSLQFEHDSKELFGLKGRFDNFAERSSLEIPNE